MIPLSVTKLAEITASKNIPPSNRVIKHIITDSRELAAHPETSLFVALRGGNHDGHDFLRDVYNKGVRNFMISDTTVNQTQFKNSHFLLVDDSMNSLHLLASYVRQQFDGQVLAITGSNGKTIVKEWLYNLLHDEYHIIRSPKSYNSQLGVALSLLLLDNTYDLAIIEAGISKPGEMAKLEKIIKPDIVVFTGIGTAHQENFRDIEHKLKEKSILFKDARTLIYRSENLTQTISHRHVFRAGYDTDADVIITAVKTSKLQTEISFKYQDKKQTIRIPFNDKASFGNTLTCLATVCALGKCGGSVLGGFLSLSAVEMRLEMKEGINACRLIKDTYNSDINSLQIALELLSNQEKYEKKTLILSDILQSGMPAENLYAQVAEMIMTYGISKLIAIGFDIFQYQEKFNKIAYTAFYKNTDEFLRQLILSDFSHEAILIKGARTFKFERISEKLQQKKHTTRLEISMEAVQHNLDYYRSLVSPKTKILVMVKAFSYGSGLGEIARFLEYHQVDYLGVAYIDEGVKLRKSGVRMPILVMNPDADELSDLLRCNLEPEIYNFRILNRVISELKNSYHKEILIHVKFDSGMSRLGFSLDDIVDLQAIIKQNPQLRIKSIFTHLAGTDEAVFDNFTNKQVLRFSAFYDALTFDMTDKPLRHVLNSSGVERFPEFAFDMVRLGIGIYGFSPNNGDKLRNIASFKTNISQIKHIKKGDTVGYSRRYKATEDRKIAVIPVGYADGLNRRLSNGMWHVQINEKLVPVIGNICMDMFMADITDIRAEEGDEVIIFGDRQTAQDMANILDTIPYEILTGISQRVKRVYFYS